MSYSYPGNAQNKTQTSDEISHDASFINQPAGTIEFINTQGEESLTIGHKNGTYVRLDKYGREELVTRNSRLTVLGDIHNNYRGAVVNNFMGGVENIYSGDVISTTGDPAKQQPLIEEYKSKIKGLHDDQRLFEIQRTKSHNGIDQSPLQKKSGELAPCPTDAVIGKFLTSRMPSEVISRAIKASCFRTVFIFNPTIDTYHEIPVGGGINCFTCWGTGLSPSSQDGKWTPEAAKEMIKDKREKLQDDLYNIEKKLGQTKNPSGGTQISNISKDMIMNVGLAFNDLESFRRDPKGKLVPYGVKIDPFGGSIYTQYRESSLIEVVDVERFPGGAYEINANNNYRITAGSGGIDLKTTGPMHLYAPIVTMTSESTLFNSRGEISFGAERLDFSGDIITIRPNKVTRSLEDASGKDVKILPTNLKSKTEPEQQLLVDGNLNVAMNSIIRGGLHVEGEVSLHHITAPMEYHITESDFEINVQTPCGPTFGIELPCVPDVQKGPTHADILPGCLIGYAQIGSGSSAGVWPVVSTFAPNSVLVHPHFHTFKNLPMKLLEGDNDMTIKIGDRYQQNDANRLAQEKIDEQTREYKKISEDFDKRTADADKESQAILDTPNPPPDRVNAQVAKLDSLNAEAAEILKAAQALKKLRLENAKAQQEAVTNITLSPHDAVRAIGARNNFANVVLAKPVQDSTTPTTVIEKFGGKCGIPLVIDNCSWGEPNRNDDLPSGEGVGTSNYTPEAIVEKNKEIESKSEQMYKAVQIQLATQSKENPQSNCDEVAALAAAASTSPPSATPATPESQINQESNANATANTGALNINAAQSRCSGLPNTGNDYCLRESRKTVAVLTGNSYYDKGYSSKDYSLQARTNWFLGGKNKNGQQLYTNIGKVDNNFQTGDVIIYSNGGYGHVETNVNGRWYSDFKQANNSIGNGYSDYTVLRLNYLDSYSN